MIKTVTKLSLFDIQKEYLELMEMIEENEGVLDEVDEAALAISHKEFAVKAENYIAVIKHCESELTKAKDAEAQIAVFKKRKQTVIDKLKENLENAVKLFGPTEAGFFKLSLRKSESVVVENQAIIPSAYLNNKVVTTVDKTKIKKAIKEGEDVPGAYISENKNLQIK